VDVVEPSGLFLADLGRLPHSNLGRDGGRGQLGVGFGGGEQDAEAGGPSCLQHPADQRRRLADGVGVHQRAFGHEGLGLPSRAPLVDLPGELRHPHRARVLQERLGVGGAEQEDPAGAGAEELGALLGGAEPLGGLRRYDALAAHVAGAFG
jgi:hypothetical protein